MEHLLAPDGAKPIFIPYVCRDMYEQCEQCEQYEEYPEHQELERRYGYPKDSMNSLSNFKGFLERRGWKRDSTHNPIFDGHTPDEIVAFLQTWLYFGTLISVFRSVGIPVRTSDFVSISDNGNRVVNTLRLPGLIAEWMRRESISVGPVYQNFNGPNHIRGQNIREILNWTFWHAGMFDLGAQEKADNPNNILSLVKLPIMALGESLSSALVVIYGYDLKTMPTWGPSPVLKHRLREAGWCISDSPFFPESLVNSSISADYYFGGYTCPRQRGDHSECSEIICHAYQQQIDTSNHKAKHISSCHSCDHIPAPENVVETVRQGGIPVISWDGTTLNAKTFVPPMKYVAISHVWSDGLGNDEKHNSLFRCQASRIQELVTCLYAESHLSSNSGHMPQTNQQEPIGFWLDTLCVPVGKENSSVRKSAIRQMGDIYRQADRVLVLDSFIQKLPRETDIIEKYLRLHLSNWHHRLWTLQEGQLGKTLFFQFQDGAQTFYDMMHPERHLDLRDPTNICSPVRMLCAIELEAFYRHFEDVTATANISVRMRSCAKYLRSRQTTRVEDEPLCVSTILGLDSGRLLAHDVFEDRMMSFYDSIKEFDPRIIFNNHPRLQRDGYRWAPQSFLHQLPDLIAVREVGMAETPPVTLFPNGGGLPVRFPGLELHNIGSNLGSSVFVLPKIDTVPLTQQYLSSPSRPPWWKRWYKLEIHPDTKDFTWDTRLRYAVVMYTDLHPDHLPAPAIVGTIEVRHHRPGMDEPFTEADMELKLEPQRSIAATNSAYPVYEVPQRITLRYLCGATVSEVSQEALMNARRELEPQLYRHIQENLAGFAKKQFKKTGWLVGQDDPSPISSGMHPISATVYSRVQKWCIL